MSDKFLQIRNSTAEFLIFTSQVGKNTIEVRVEDETVWLTQKLIAALFEVDVRTINEHLGNIFKSNELQEKAVIRNFRITASDGKNYNTNFYNLDAIISVGYRVNSLRATQFRQWATGVLRNFAIRGYVLDKERLKNGAFFSSQELSDCKRVEVFRSVCYHVSRLCRRSGGTEYSNEYGRLGKQAECISAVQSTGNIA